MDRPFTEIAGRGAPQRPTLPFAHLNLRVNPFGELAMESRGALALSVLRDDELGAVVDELRKPGFAVQFLGGKGRGKTTQLLVLRRRFPNAAYVHFPEDGHVPDVPGAALVFLDELQRMPPPQRRRMFRNEASWVIGSHEDHARDFDRAGLRYRTFQLGDFPARFLHRVLNGRIRWAARDPDRPLPFVAESTVQELILRYHDDVRTMESVLYDAVQEMREVGNVEV